MKKSFLKEKGNRTPADYFVGEVYANMLLDDSDHLDAIMGIVYFEKGARTNWHTHTAGQILVVTEGVGYYQEKGGEKVEINVGDVIKIPRDVAHWHGASVHSHMKHIAIVPEKSKDKTTWLAPVTDYEFNS